MRALPKRHVPMYKPWGDDHRCTPRDAEISDLIVEPRFAGDDVGRRVKPNLFRALYATV